MADNTGNYISQAKLLVELGNAGAAVVQKLALSGKSGNTFNFATSATPAPAIGDFIVQGEYSSVINAVTSSPNTLTVADATNIANGAAKYVATSFDETDLASLIKQAMDFIDRHTRQWFNRREFSDLLGNTVRLEGNNSKVLFLPVPIITITSLRKNNSDAVLEPTAYRAYNGRALPDDRRNPMIKLVSSDDDVLMMSSGHFMRGAFTRLEGAFGYLEVDGSTPTQIQRATAKLATIYAVKTIGDSASTSASSAGAGAVKREKTDLHEIEYYDPNAGTGTASTARGTGLSGDDEIDGIIAAFRGPPIVAGTFPDMGMESPVIQSLQRR